MFIAIDYRMVAFEKVGEEGIKIFRLIYCKARNSFWEKR
jgi:hypothetical protein